EDNEAVLFVVDLFNGTVRQKIVLEEASGNNGLAGVSAALDPVTRTRTFRVYGGDLNGTMWRVDFNEAGNGSSRYANGLFTTQNNRPITSAPALAANPNGGMMVYFGTGKLIETVDRLQSGIELETMYAIRDRERDVPFTQLGNPEISIVDGQRTIIGETGPLGWALRL
ncbi:MAG: PilC/PilY family type IV pilus protein, partial [Wenzhouxiangellaceae bacterium]